MIAYSSSTANTISAAAFNTVRALHHVLGERVRHGEAPSQVYAQSLQNLRQRLRGVYGIRPADDIDIAWAPSGTDLELLVLSLALASGAPVTNILVGEDEVGSGCVFSAQGQHFRDRTALVDSVPKGNTIRGFDATRIALHKVEVRQPSGQTRAHEVIVADIRAAVDAALSRGRRPVVHVVHRSKTGIVVPGMAQVEALARDYGSRIDITIDACQGRISPDNLRHYLGMGASVMVTGSKFIGGPAFCAFVFVPGNLSQRLRARGAGLPEGLNDYFLPAEMPAGWVTAGSLLRREVANFGLLLRLEAAVFELQRLSVLPPQSVLAVVDTFGRAVRTFTDRSAHFDLFIAAAGLRPESHIEHPFERDMLFTLKVNGNPPVLFSGAKALYEALYEDRSGAFPDSAELRAVAAEEIHVGQPVRCLRDAQGAVLGTLRISLSAPLISEMAGLDDEAKLERFGADFARLERKVNLLLSARPALPEEAV
jgi:hypothetical protein